MRKSLLNRLLFSLAPLGLAPASPAVPPAQPISIETLAKHPSFRSPRLSPNGRYLATLIPIGNRSNLAVIDLDTMKATPITGFDSIDVGEYDGDEVILSTAKYDDDSLRTYRVRTTTGR